jgi:hypothetical protein
METIKVVVEIDKYDAEDIARIFKKNPTRKDVKRIAQAFAQNLIDRYFSIEHLDSEKIEEYLEEEENPICVFIIGEKHNIGDEEVCR